MINIYQQQLHTYKGGDINYYNWRERVIVNNETTKQYKSQKKGDLILSNNNNL